MTEAKHIVNVLTFSHPEKEHTFEFKLKKTDGHIPLRKGEFPQYFLAQHGISFSNFQYQYCYFKSTYNSKCSTKVDLTKSIYFAKHYYHLYITHCY